MKSASSVAIACALLGAGCGGATPPPNVRAEAEAKILGMPQGVFDGSLNAAAAGQQVGSARLSSTERVGLITNGLGGSGVIQPGGYTDTSLLGTDGTYQVGTSVVRSDASGQRHAIVIAGTSDSLVDLHPSGFVSSGANAVEGGQQVGWAVGESGSPHPFLWMGTPESAVDLLPAGHVSGVVHDVLGGVQAGASRASSDSHAAVWLGSAESYQDLNPPGYRRSALYALSLTEYVGAAIPSSSLSDNAYHAMRWVNGGVVDLHPSGKFASWALDTTGTIQVGSFWPDSHENQGRACLWRGTAASFLDLHRFLPATYRESRATGVEGNIVSGWAARSDGNFIPVLWQIAD